MQIGKFNLLQVSRFTDHGAYLIDQEDNEVLLPNKYVEENLSIDDEVRVFIYRDSEDRLVATTLVPLIELNGFSYLKIKDISIYGAFADWGLEKDLLVPFKEQRARMNTGRYYLLSLQIDQATDRLFATTKTNKFLESCSEDYAPTDKVDLLICERTDIGQKVIVDNRFGGIIYSSDLTRELKPGQRIDGYVYKVREDGKLDVRLDPPGRERIDASAEKLLSILEKRGRLNLTDKSHPEVIREAVGMSKKTFKQAVGSLYKQRLIELQQDQIVYLGSKD